MEFGNRLAFGITIGLDDDYGGPWLFGKICYWANGIQIGDYDLGTSLRDVLLQMKWIVNDCGKRHNAELFTLDTDTLCEKLTKALTGRGDEITQEGATRDTWARFDVRIPVDVFDRWRVFLVDGSEMSRMVICDASDNIWECELPVGEFDRVFLTCYQTLDIAYEEELRRDERVDEH